MAYVCTSPKTWVGEAIGHCVPLVQEACGAPQTALWKQGIPVRNNMGIAKGTAIATFVSGKYPNQPTGNHAAIYMGQNGAGLLVIDQWIGQPAREGVLRFEYKGPNPGMDGDNFYVID